MLILVIGAVVYLLRSFYGIVCELSGVVGALVTVGIRVVVIGFCEWLVVFDGSCLFGISVVLVFCVVVINSVAVVVYIWVYVFVWVFGFG